jgi:hypothetical protein
VRSFLRNGLRYKRLLLDAALKIKGEFPSKLSIGWRMMALLVLSLDIAPENF